MTNKPKITKKGGRFSFRLTLFIVILLLITNVMLGAFYLVLMELDEIVLTPPLAKSPILLILFSIFVSVGIGICLVMTWGKTFTKPITDLTRATQRVASGDFDVKIEEKGDNEISELIKNFNKMTNDLKKNETLKSDFIANVSHEFKTPLSNIQGYAMLLQDENLCENDKYSYTQAILESTKSLTELITNILKLTKLENQDTNLEIKTYSLDEQIRQSILLFETQWTEKNINLDVDLEDVTIKFDEGLLTQVWNNLISNAIKFVDNEGTIQISLKKTDENAIVVITDDGVGMSEEVQSRIFDKFYQGDNSHLKVGNGLGLAIVKKIIELVNGTIEVNSQVGKGSQFIVRLPLSI